MKEISDEMLRAEHQLSCRLTRTLEEAAAVEVMTAGGFPLACVMSLFDVCHGLIFGMSGVSLASVGEGLLCTNTIVYVCMNMYTCI